MGGCASADTGGCATGDDGCTMREEGYNDDVDGQEIKVYINAKGQNVMVVVNIEWSVVRLKRGLRFLNALFKWQWCRVFNLSDDKELPDQQTLSKSGVRSMSILRLIIHDLPNSAAGVISMVQSKKPGVEPAERIAGLLEVGHQILQNENSTEEAESWWNEGIYDMLSSELYNGVAGESSISKASFSANPNPNSNMNP